MGRTLINIFVTVGTTPFPELLKALQEIENPSWSFLCQTAEKDVNYPGLASFDFSPEIEQHVEQADLIISHAGAGSVYRFLEQQVKLLVVPNLFRKDPHQRDLADYCMRNGLCKVCYSLDSLHTSIQDALSFDAKPYVKDAFFKGDEINQIINDSLK